MIEFSYAAISWFRCFFLTEKMGKYERYPPAAFTGILARFRAPNLIIKKFSTQDGVPFKNVYFDFDTDLWNENFNLEAGDRLIDWEKRVNTVLKIRPGHFHDADKTVCQFNPRTQYLSKMNFVLEHIWNAVHLATRLLYLHVVDIFRVYPAKLHGQGLSIREKLHLCPFSDGPTAGQRAGMRIPGRKVCGPRPVQRSARSCRRCSVIGGDRLGNGRRFCSDQVPVRRWSMFDDISLYVFGERRGWPL